MTAQTLDQWLANKYGIEKKDLNIRIQKVTDNVSRYSKESTIEKNGKYGSFDQWLDAWIDEVERSALEDEKNRDREGVDCYIAESIQAVRIRLTALGETITLDQFPFKEIPESVRGFVVRALQKEIASVIAKLKNLGTYESAVIYADNELSAVLARELDS